MSEREGEREAIPNDAGYVSRAVGVNVKLDCRGCIATSGGWACCVMCSICRTVPRA